MTRRQYEMMKRRRQQNLLAFGILGALAVALIVAAVLILKPAKPAQDACTASCASVTASADPYEQEVHETPEPSAPAGAEAPDAGDEVQPGDDAETGTDVEAGSAVDFGTDGDAGVGEEDGTVGEAVVQPAATPRPAGLRSVRMRVIGDVMVCQSQLNVYASSGYDFHPEFSYISEMLQNADYTMANMEGTVGKYKTSAYSGYPQFNCPETILEALKDSGVDFLTLANNHMLDRWFDGLKNTVGWVQQYGFDYVGAYRTQEERNTPVVVEVNGIKIGFVAYTHSTNTMENRGVDPDAVKYGVPYLYKSDIAADIQRVRDAGAEVVIAFPHWGKEYVRTPDSTQVQYAKKLAVAGADIILGSHSHMVQPMGFKYVTDSQGRQRQIFIMFSLGNFLSDHVKQYCDAGIIVDFTIYENADGTFTVDDVGYIPTYTWQPTEGDARVIPSGNFLNNRPVGMSDAAYKRMVESYNEIVEAIGSEFPVLNS